MPLDHYRTLGRSGLRVSPFCLGTMTFGEDWGWGCSADDACAIMDAYLDAGGNFIDTANIYTKGHSETIIGDHIGKHPARRNRIVIATKFLGNMYLGDPNGGGAHRKSMIAACEESLRRLQTDYIDLYWMHFWDKLTPIEETMRAMDDLVTAGKVRYLGVSDTPAWTCAKAQGYLTSNDRNPIIGLQIEYSLLQRTVENELVPMALDMGMGITPWSPLKYGVLTGKYTRDNRDEITPNRGEGIKKHLHDNNMNIVETVVEIASQIHATPAQVALKWVLDRPGVVSPILGVRTLEQLKDNLGALDIILSSEHRAALDDISAIEPTFPQNFLPFVKHNVQGGTTINGEPSEPWTLAPQNDSERW